MNQQSNHNQGDLLGMPSGQEAAVLVEKAALDLPADRWAPTLAAMVAVLTAALKRQGIPEDEAPRLATAGVLAQAEYAGGRMMYLPRGDRLRLALRDAEIWQRAKRGNIDALAQEYGLSDIHIYRICKQQRELYIARRQGRLDFGREFDD